MRIPDDLTDCTIFVSPDYGVSAESRRFGGTAFFISVPDGTQSSGQRICLVTARHVGENLNAKKFTIRQNTTKGGSEWIEVEANVTWWFHPDDTAADVALLSFSIPPHSDLKAKIIPSSMFATDDDFASGKIGLGSEVSIVGLFTQMAGTTRNFPIVRSGNIAMLPTERVETERYGPADLHLIDATSVNGLSGSPVFVARQIGTDYAYSLLGLIHGHYDVPAKKKDGLCNRAVPTEDILVNIGVSMVVPARKILEVANHPRLVESINRQPGL